MKTIIYKGEDVSLTFTSVTDISGYEKTVKYFTPFSEIKVATITNIDAYSFTAKLRGQDTLHLNVGPLNIVIEFSNEETNLKMISKTIFAKMVNSEENGGIRDYNTDYNEEIVFLQNTPIAINFNGLTNKISSYSISAIESITQVEYDALETKDPATIYLIKSE